MCQLAAYVGDRPIAPLLLRTIELQEPYFGAHASGLGVINGGNLRVEKDAGHLAKVRGTTNIESLNGTTEIAHSRYNATARDDPRYNTMRMSHPFVDCTGTLCLMHNGGISNYKDHWERLRKEHVFTSYEAELDAITDSEIAVHMLEDAVKEGMFIEEGLRRMASQLTGSFLLACISTEHPETVWIANWHQPCVVAVGEDDAIFCSSHIGLSEVRHGLDRVFEPPKNSLVKLTRGHIEVMPLDPGRKVPGLRLDKNKLGRLIIDVLRQRDEVDFRNLWNILYPDSWAQAFGIKPEEFKDLRKRGVGIVNPYIETLDMLIAEGKIRRRIDSRLEAGVERTPRFAYSLSK